MIQKKRWIIVAGAMIGLFASIVLSTVGIPAQRPTQGITDYEVCMRACVKTETFKVCDAQSHCGQRDAGK